jgi:hypothetical protein
MMASMVFMEADELDILHLHYSFPYFDGLRVHHATLVGHCRYVGSDRPGGIEVGKLAEPGNGRPEAQSHHGGFVQLVGASFDNIDLLDSIEGDSCALFNSILYMIIILGNTVDGYVLRFKSGIKSYG